MFTRSLDARWGVDEAMAKRLDGSDLAVDLARIGDLETIAPFVSRLAQECRARGIDFRNAFELRMADSNQGFGSSPKALGSRWSLVRMPRTIFVGVASSCRRPCHAEPAETPRPDDRPWGNRCIGQDHEPVVPESRASSVAAVRTVRRDDDHLAHEARAS